MLPIRFFAVVLVSAYVLGNVNAAGLIHTLPEDGAGAVFDFEQEGTATFPGKEFPIASKGTVQIAIVGTQEVAGLLCRWVEIEVRADRRIGDERMAHFEWWKFLIPESELARPQEGISMALRIYTTSEQDAAEPRLITGKEERRVNLRKIGEYLPRPPTEANRINVLVTNKVAKTPAGDFKCDCHVFDAHTDLYALPPSPSRLQQTAIYRVWTNQECPMGVAAMEIQSSAQEVNAPLGGFAEDGYRLEVSLINLISQLKLQQVDRGVVSRYPEHHE